MRFLTPADYRSMPWANGRGVTVEMLKETDAEGGLLWRLSMATVAEDGPFSLFPGIERNLTVIEGPGFRLSGDGIDLVCAPLCPQAFPGDVPVRAEGTQGQVSRDLNVMTARHLPRPEVAVLRGSCRLPAGDMLCLFALEDTFVDGQSLTQHGLLITQTGAMLHGPGSVVAIRLFG